MEEFRSALRAGDPVVGAWVSIGHPAVAEIAAGLGFEFVTIDMEHAAIGVETVENLVRAVEAADGDATPVVRVPAADPVVIKRVLDTGAGGLLVPRVDGPEDARTVVEATRYPPEGVRGTAAGRASDYGRALPEYLDRADRSIARILQVETRSAVDRAGEIAAVEAVDAVFVGPADLSAALGVPFDYDADRFRAAVESVVDAAHEAGTPTGVFVTDPDRMEEWLSLGFEFAIVGFDAQFLIEGNRRLKRAFESAVEGE